MRKLPPLLVAILLLVLSTPTATAQDPITTTLYLPFVGKAPPQPYNLPAKSLVLQLEDMPSGYELDVDESGPVELSDENRNMGMVDGYENWYSDFDRFFTGTSAVGNLVTVFKTPQDAQNHIQYIQQEASNLPDFKSFRSVPSIGDEVIAIEFENTEGLFPVTGYYIIFRKGNLESLVAGGGITSVVELDDTVWFARKSLTRINDQIALGY